MTNTNLLKSHIVRNGMTQEDLANKTGISRTSLTLKINNKRVFDANEIDKICKVLNIKDSKEKAKIFLA